MHTTPVVFVDMPFSAFIKPSYSLSVLKACLTARRIGSRVFYGNMLFSRYAGLDDYLTVLYKTGQRLLLPETIFLAEAGLKSEAALESYFAALSRAKTAFSAAQLDTFIALTRRLQPAATAFLDDLTGRVLACRPKIVGMSSMFFQNNACIALARRLKTAAPAMVIVVGGPNVWGEAGDAMVKKVPWFDFAFSGEADECIADLCAAALTFGRAIPDGLLPYGTLGKAPARAGGIPVRYTRDLDTVPVPDYSDYFQSLAEYRLQDEIDPALFTEFSRGCWWHDRGACTFCGLNSEGNSYRIKSTAKILHDLKQLHHTYNIKRFSLTDNILSPIHLRELTPRLAALPEKYELFAEIKSNLSKRQIHGLRQAGFKILQPGIESLHDQLLHSFHKGNRAIKHIELLRDLDASGIFTLWQLLGGAPDEKETWYEELNELLPSLSHLPPPQQLAHIIFTRYSAYVNAPERYGLKLRPSSWYRLVFPDDPQFIARVAFIFEPLDAKARDIYYNIHKKGPVYENLQRRIVEWLTRFHSSRDRLEVTRRADCLEILDLRLGARTTFHRLAGIEREIYEGCEQTISVAALRRKLAGKAGARRFDSALAALKSARLILEIGGELLALGVPAARPPYMRTPSPFGVYRKMRPPR